MLYSILRVFLTFLAVKTASSFEQADFAAIFVF